MLLNSIKKPKFPIPLLIVFIAAAFLSFKAEASECGIMIYLKDKSRGVEVLDNACKPSDEIALGTVFNLTSGGRLWLKSLPAPDTDSDFQVICQSRSASVINLRVSDIFLPWITPNGLTNCSSWDNQHMSCDDLNGNKNSFFCAVALIKRTAFDTGKNMKRKASVTLRSPDNTDSESIGIEQVLASMSQETGLCRKLFHADQPIEITWVINKTGTAKNIAVKSRQTAADSQFVDCVLDVVKYFPYPSYTNEVTVAHTF